MSKKHDRRESHKMQLNHKSGLTKIKVFSDTGEQW